MPRENGIMFYEKRGSRGTACRIACAANVPELKSLASGRLAGGAGPSFGSRPRPFFIRGKKRRRQWRLVNSRCGPRRNNACWRARARISLPIKGRRVTPRPTEAIRVPVRRMNFNSRRRIEFAKSRSCGGGREEGGWRGEKWKKASVTGLEREREKERNDRGDEWRLSASETKWKEGRETQERTLWNYPSMSNGFEKFGERKLSWIKFYARFIFWYKNSNLLPQIELISSIIEKNFSLQRCIIWVWETQVCGDEGNGNCLQLSIQFYQTLPAIRSETIAQFIFYLSWIIARIISSHAHTRRGCMRFDTARIYVWPCVWRRV